MKIETLKNFGSMDKSFKEWLTTCPKEYIWQINEVTKGQGTFTFRRQTNEFQFRTKRGYSQRLSC